LPIPWPLERFATARALLETAQQVEATDASTARIRHQIHNEK
jgi:hypothetical protein